MHDALLSSIASRIPCVGDAEILSALLGFDDRHWNWEGTRIGSRAMVRMPGTDRKIDVVRHLFERRYEEGLDRFVRARRNETCDHRGCVNPTHYHLHACTRHDGRIAMVPYRYWLEHHDEIGDLVDHILDSGVPLTLSVTEMRARFGPEFSADEYAEALRRIGEQGW